MDCRTECQMLLYGKDRRASGYSTRGERLRFHLNEHFSHPNTPYARKETVMYLIGYDIGSSSIKATLLDAETGKTVTAATSPAREMAIDAPRPGWAEQHPDTWWKHVVLATGMILHRAGIDPSAISAIGISYQMHGLVIVDRDRNVLRPSIIWCDSRAVEIGNRAFRELGEEACLRRLLNSPGNFTASKLRWVRENEPELFGKIHKAMLPGDYIAMRMTGDISTTPSGLSEGIMWDYIEGGPADMVLDYYGIPREMLPTVKPTFAVQGEMTSPAAAELGLRAGIPVAYRAGDQPNNALSLSVLHPGEIAATAGTSGVVYGVTDTAAYDPLSRVNPFVHVTHTGTAPRYGVLMCINGTGILNSWLKHNCAPESMDYPEMNDTAAAIRPGSDGLTVIPYGNGAERTLENQETGAAVLGLSLTTHTQAHLLRAGQEGIVFAFRYGLEIMKEMGVPVETVRAGHANMFLSPVFRDAFAASVKAAVELYDTDGSQGAARGAGIGAEVFPSPAEAFAGLQAIEIIKPDETLIPAYDEAYERWKEYLMNVTNRRSADT